ncbi:MAG: T9SS type A sorting domain-containing protein [Bacteroidetes bacterium]|nr:T9SS type A sorting domain-containing protein [Bacteroidota bacterium]MBK9300788.1 T9SS type A sorting domain-containing protein [Bacteroidota bacterium]MBK9480468.1 T9SS type A sorting domain-containing protein [Bacteroidota bacterium]
MKNFLLFLTALFVSGSLFAHEHHPGDVNPNITPFNDAIEAMSGVSSAHLQKLPEWKNFKNNYPSWGARFSNYTRMPHRAFGEPITYTAGGNDPVAKALAFIQNEFQSFNIPMNELVLTRNNNDGKYINVDFKQVHNGHEILWSRVGVRFSQDLKIVMVTLDAHRNVPQLNAAISPANAILNAEKSINTPIVNTTIDPSLKIFPYPTDGKFEYKLVYVVNVHTQDDNVTPGNYLTYVDAINGNILYRQNKVVHIGFTVKGDIYPINSFSTPDNRPLKNLQVNISGTNYFTDATGLVTAPPAGPVTPTISLQGKYVKVVTGANGNTVATYAPANVANGNTVTFQPTNPNGTDRHINVYYHTNEIHDFMKLKFPLFTTMDNALTARVDRTDGDCNAFYNGTSINFYTTANGCNALSYVGDVMYHEYGHGINDKFWTSQGSSFDNGAMGEGYADVWAMSIIKNPFIGLGFFVNQPNSLIRRYDINPKIYPQNIVGEVHADGEIIAGAWWDYAINLSATMPLTNAVDTMSKLFAASNFGLATGPDGAEGQVYYDILIDALTYDDDNANLNDGTPHFTQIVEAFAAHGIYLLMNSDLAHAAPGVVNGGTPITLSADAIADFPVFLGNVKMFYRLKGAGGLDSLTMTKSGTNYTAVFPSSTMGEIYEYYFNMYDNAGAFATSSPKESKFTILASQRNLPHFLAIGYNQQYHQDFENVTAGTPNWYIGNAPSDNATAGKWIVAVPISSATNGDMVQTGADHTTGSGKCAVTGNAANANAQAGSADVDGGRTSLITDEIDLTSYSSPFISYFRWFSNSQSSSSPRKDPWKAYGSYDNGTTWFQLERTFQPDVSWRRNIFIPNLGLGSKVRFMFVATDSAQNGAPGTWVEAALDDIEVFALGNTPAGIHDISTLQSAVYPNPAHTDFTILTPEKGALSYTLTNSIGAIILQHSQQVNATNKVNVDVSQLSAGFYFLKLEMNGKQSIHKISISK